VLAVTALARETADTTRAAAGRGAFASRDYRLFWSGALASNVGTWMQNAAVPFVMYGLTRSSAWVGLAAFAMLFPGVVLGPVAGALADRLDRRRLLFWSQAAQALAAFGLAALWAAGVHQPGAVLALVSVGGVIFGLSMPAWQGFITDLVPREDLPSAVTYNSLQFHGSRAIGPALGGLVLATAGPAWAFAANGVSYAAVLVAISLVRARPGRPAPTGERVAAQLRSGFAYVRRHRGIGTAIGLAFALGFLGNTVVQLAPVFAARVYGVGAGAYGVLTAAFGVGAAVGIFLLGRAALTRARSGLVIRALFGLGLALIALGFSPSYPLGLVAVLVAGGCAVGSGTLLLTTVQMQVDDRMRGRVLGVYAMAFTASYPVGALAQGALADLIGPRATGVLVGFTVLVLATALFARRDLTRGLDAARDAPPA
jgi:MFS family permease